MVPLDFFLRAPLLMVALRAPLLMIPLRAPLLMVVLVVRGQNVIKFRAEGEEREEGGIDVAGVVFSLDSPQLPTTVVTRARDGHLRDHLQ